jgi:two-component system nitrogen regulation response regulator NtrX
MKKDDVLVVDDEKDIRGLICDALQDHAYTTREAANSDQVLKKIEEKIPDLVILDIWLQGSELDGLGILEIIQKKHPHLPVLIISGHGTIETAVKSIKMGAYDYLEKPFTEDKLLIMVKRACESGRLKRENLELKSKVTESKELIGDSPKLRNLKALVEKVAITQSRVLIRGEPGTGKKLIAEMIYKKSKRSDEAFVIFDAAGLSEMEALNELFGMQFGNQNGGGSLTKLSILELANHGTLFIKEVGELSLAVQKKLLGFLQDQVLPRGEGGESVKLDVRVIASTSKDLGELIKSGRFREDLYYRLNVVELFTPPLAERKEDIPLIADYYFTFLNKAMSMGYKKLSKEASILMQSYHWPGNIRQLRNVVEWILIMSPKNEDVVTTEMLPPDIKPSLSGQAAKGNNVIDDSGKLLSMTLRDAREVFECHYLKSQLERFNGNITQMSNYIGMERSALHRKLKSLQIYNVAE